MRGKKNMHREIQIKQFPIVTTHWWPKTRNERFEKTNSIYIVFYLLYTTMSKWCECAHTSGVWRVCARALAHAWRRACLKFRVLGHQCVVTMGNCLIWISLCMFFFPLIETVTYTCHYMTDRLERFDLKTSKLDLLKKKSHLHLGCPWGELIDTTF